MKTLKNYQTAVSELGELSIDGTQLLYKIENNKGIQYIEIPTNLYAMKIAVKCSLECIEAGIASQSQFNLVEIAKVTVSLMVGFNVNNTDLLLTLSRLDS